MYVSFRMTYCGVHLFCHLQELELYLDLYSTAGILQELQQ